MDSNLKLDETQSTCDSFRWTPVPLVDDPSSLVLPHSWSAQVATSCSTPMEESGHEKKVCPSTTCSSPRRHRTTLLFPERKASTHSIRTQGHADGGDGELLQPLVTKMRVGDGMRGKVVTFPASPPTQLKGSKPRVRLTLEENMSGDCLRRGSETPLRRSDGSGTALGQKQQQQQQWHSLRSSIVGVDPGWYNTLLPDTHIMRMEEESRAGPVFGSAANEIFAWRDAQRAAQRLVATNPQETESKAPLELRQFEKGLKLLQERERQFRRRWRPNLFSIAARSGGAVVMLNDGDDVSSEGEFEHRGTSDFASSYSKHGQFVQDGQSNYAAYQEQMRALKLLGEDAQGAVILRNELKASMRDVVKARSGVTVADLLAKRRAQEEHQSVCDVVGANAFSEDVSWGGGNAERPQDHLPLLSSFHAPGGGFKCGSGSNATGDIVPCRKSEVFDVLLARRKGSVIRWSELHLEPSHGVKGSKRSVRHRLPPAPLMSLRLQQKQPLLDETVTIHPLSLTTNLFQPKIDEVALKGRSTLTTRRTWKASPVECGVGYKTRVLHDAQLAQQRMDEILLELKHGEDLRHTRQLLLGLLPERAQLLDESLEHMHGGASAALRQRQEKLFQKASSIDAEERRQTYLAYVDLMEDFYRSDFPDNLWPPVLKVLQKTRELIYISPRRCNTSSFQNIVRDSFHFSHLAEAPVHEILWRLAQLFDITQSEFKSLISSVLQGVHQTHDHQERFREIERTLVGMISPVERRIRITLHRCRFFLHTVGVEHNSNLGGSGSGGGAIAREGGVDQPDISVQLKTPQRILVSKAVRAHVNSSMYANGASQRGSVGGSNVLHYYVNLLKQAFRLYLQDETPLEVSLLCNGESVGSSELLLGDCTFNSRGVALLWLRVFSKECVQGEIKLSVEQLGERERSNKVPAKQPQPQTTTTTATPAANVQKKQTRKGAKKLV